MQLRNLSISFGLQTIFKDANIIFNKNDKIGIVGVNGAGKTTLFNIITKKIDPDSGRVILNNNERIELLPQVIDDEVPSKDITVLEFLMLGRPIQKLEKELEKQYNLIAKEKDIGKQNIIYKQIDKIQSKLDYYEYYSAENTLLKIISGMGINSNMLDKRLNEISGGQKSKIAFAKLLYSKPEVILLDEPTNHLDKESRNYIIDYLKHYKGSVFVISHDIDFLNSITNKTLYLDKINKSMELFDGNYNYYKKTHEARKEILKKQTEIQDREASKLRDVVLLYSNSSGKRKRMAQDREKKLNKLLENKILIEQDQKYVNVNMEMNRESNKIPLKIDKLCFKYDKTCDKNIIDNLSFDIKKGEKFLIVGHNGIGKSTLLKLIVGQLQPDSGNIIFGNKTDIGYYAQEHELLDLNKNIIDNFSDVDISINKLRGVLGRFLFFGDDVFKKVNILSPGERSRVALAKLSLSGANLILLDEPTNHLDPETQKIIADTFRSFKGTMLVVSHNPEFVDNLGIERSLNLSTQKINDYKREIVEKYYKINSKNNK